MPDVDRVVAFHDGERAAAPVGAILVWDANVAAALIPLPAVKRALQDLPHHVSAVSEVGAQVFAVGVHHGQLSRLCTPCDQFAAEVLHPVHVADLISSDQATWNHPVGVIDSGGLAMIRNHRAFNVKRTPRLAFRPRCNPGNKRRRRTRGDSDGESGEVVGCRLHLLVGFRPGGLLNREKVNLGGDSSGRLVAAIAGEPDQLDPNKTSAYFSFEVLENVYDTLVEPDADLQMRPALAESWDVTPDQLTWTFRSGPASSSTTAAH